MSETMSNVTLWRGILFNLIFEGYHIMLLDR